MTGVVCESVHTPDVALRESVHTPDSHYGNLYTHTQMHTHAHTHTHTRCYADTQHGQVRIRYC
jgi:hypothetical protein